jgi:uncharacterized protein (TIGR02118 family)
MIKEALGDALKGLELNIGLAGRAPGEPAPYVAIAHLTFDSVEVFQAFMPHSATFAADIPNYTNTKANFKLARLF